jgi:hypothetical protein
VDASGRYTYHAALYVPEASGAVAGTAAGTTGGLTGSAVGFVAQYSTERLLDVRDFGAVGDYLVATGVGTDDTAAFPAAINAAAGRVVYLPPGRYKTTAPLVLKQGTHLTGPFELRRGSISLDATRASTIAFHGGATDNAVEAIGTVTSASRVIVENLTIHDHRTSKTTADDGSHGIYFEEVVNQTVIQHCDIRGFDAGSSIKVTATPGNSSDCVYIDDIWCLDNIYGIDIDRVDNNCVIRRIQADNTDELTEAVIRVGSISAVLLIEEVKHESSGANPSIVIDGGPGVLINGLISRAGTGGPVVQINGTGSGVLLQNIRRENTGVLVKTTDGVQDKELTGLRLPYWVGGADGIAINEARLYGLTTGGAEADVFTDGRLHASTAAVGDTGKLSVKSDTTSQKALTVTAPASHAADYLRIYDSSAVSLVRVDSTGQLLANKGLTLAGAPLIVPRAAVNDADYTVGAADAVVGVTALTAPRTITLPTPVAGRTLVIKDEAAAAATHNITVQRGNVAHTVDGGASVAITTNRGAVRLYGASTTAWHTY